MQPIHIIEANLDDPRHQDAIVEMIKAYARDPMGGGEALPADVRDRLIPGLQQHATTLIFLAFHDRQPVGIAVCFLGFSTFAARPLINIHDLAVLPDYRGQGVGRCLLEQVEHKGRMLGCCKLTLEVREDNYRAQGLYRNVGFRGIETEDKVVRNWFLQKRLDAT